MESLLSTLAATEGSAMNESQPIDPNLLPDVDYNDFEQLWFTNKVDHFNQSDMRTY